jgi:hypothetical protein
MNSKYIYIPTNVSGYLVHEKAEISANKQEDGYCI